MDDSEAPAPVEPTPARTGRSRRLAFAEQELRLISSLVLLIGLGLFFALPFVLSIGAVVFLPLVTALVLTVILSPLADRLNGWGLPNAIASLVALLIFFAVLLLALALILQPAVALFDDVPAMANQVMDRFGELQRRFAWVAQINEQLAELMNRGLGALPPTAVRAAVAPALPSFDPYGGSVGGGSPLTLERVRSRERPPSGPTDSFSVTHT